MSRRNTGQPLSDRQQVFVDEYLIDLNIAAAARRAGYAKSTAHAPDKLITPAVRAAIDERLRRRALNADIAGQAVVAELAKLAFSNILDYVTVGDDGVPRFDFTALTRDQGAAIQTLTIDYWREPIVRKRDRANKPAHPRAGGDPGEADHPHEPQPVLPPAGPWQATPRRIRVTLADKRSALIDLQRHLTASAALTEEEKRTIPRLVRYLSGIKHDEDPDGSRGRIIWKDSSHAVPDEIVRRINQLDGFGPVSNTYWRKERALQREHEAELRAMGQWTEGDDEA